MAKAAATRTVRCYICGHRLRVSLRTLSTACPGCNKAIKVEDVVVKSYTPVFDLQTCGKIRITKRGRVAAKRIQSGDGIVCEGVMEGNVETDGQVRLGPKASWKGESLQSRSLAIADGAKLLGVVTVPWHRPEPKKPTRPPTAKPKTRPMIVSTPTTKPKLAKTPQSTAPTIRKSSTIKEPKVAKTPPSTARTITKSSTIKEPKVAKKPRSTARTIRKSSTIKELKLARTPPAKAPARKKRSTKKKPARGAVATKPATASRKPSKTKKPARPMVARKKVARISQSRAKKTSRKVAAKSSRRK